MNELSSIELSCIKKADNDFSFTNEVINEIGNSEFLQNASDFLTHQRQHISNDSNYSYVWTALCACAEDLGSKLYEPILNYIDDVCNVDTCKLKSLQSMISQLGVQYTIFNDINLMPLPLRELVEVLSIKKECLLDSSKVCDGLVQFLSGNAFTSVKSTQRAYFDGEKLDEIISAAYEKILSSMVYLTYSDSTIPIWFEQRKNIYLSGFILNNPNQLEIAKIKTKYGIRQDFDHVRIADQIEDGMADISTYLIPEQKVLQLELAGRKQQLANEDHPQNLITRYSYYRERLVKQTFEFIENQYYQIKNTYLSTESYKLDNDYMVIGTRMAQQYKLLTVSNRSYFIRTEMIHEVAKAMLELTTQVRYIRDDIKTQMQKNFIKGTYLLIKFAITEYVKNNTVPTIQKLWSDTVHSRDVTVSKIEYVDPTDYFNISTMLSNDISVEGLKTRFWENPNSISSIAAIDTTNIFTSLPTIADNTKAFSDVEISTFYHDVLKFKMCSGSAEINQYYELTQFLNDVFDVGADKTFLSNGMLAVEKSDGSMTTEQSAVSKAWYEYKKSLFNKYSGLSTAATPYAYSNEQHPSYQAHPYMSSFMETESYSYPIDNIANILAENLIAIIRPYLSSNELIDDDGYLQNFWKNPINSNTDYLSRYERSTHKDDLNIDNPIIAYDGLFYPAAIKDFVDDPEKFIEQLKIDNGRSLNKWYRGLNISENEIALIRKQLTVFKNNILELYSSSVNKCYDIWQYGLDAFGNSYILVKDISAYSIDGVLTTQHLTRKSATGQLWMKKKNHPLALPALVVDVDDDTLLDDISQLRYSKASSPEVITGKCSTIYGKNSYRYTPDVVDFTFDVSKKTLTALCRSKTQTHNLVSLTINKIYSYDEEQYLFTIEDAKANLGDFSTSEFQRWSIVDNRTIAFFTKTDSPQFSAVSACIAKFDDIWTTHVSKCRLSHHGKYIPRIDHVTTSNKVAMAYIEDSILNADDNYVNYFHQNESLSAISAATQLVSSPIVVERYQLSPTTLTLNEIVDSNVNDTRIQKDSRLYNYHTHLGFYPLADSHRDPTNVTIFQDTKAYSTIKKYGFAKCQLMCPSVDLGIDFKFMLPVRMYEGFDLSDNVVESYQLSNRSKYASYNYAHYNESTQLSNIVSEDLIYNPYELARVIYDKGVIQDGNIQLRVDESFFTDYDTEAEIKDVPKYDQYAPFPFLVLSASDAYIEGKSLGKDAQLSNCCIFSLYSDNNRDDISVSWTTYHHYSGKDVIKLDFNAPLYNEPIFDKNYYNRRHTFLNLDVPGYAGYLLTYDPALRQKHVYFIKNISDVVPKFLISADVYDNIDPVETDATLLITEDSNVPFEQISALALDSPTTIYLGVQ